MSISTHAIKGGMDRRNTLLPSKKKGNKNTVWKYIPRIQTLTSFAADQIRNTDPIRSADQDLGRSIVGRQHDGHPIVSPCRHPI